MKPTQAQERSLRKLFDGNHLDREHIISLQPAAMREPMRKLFKAKVNADQLFSILFSDLSHASGEMKSHPGDQFWRRTTIRALAVTLDGIMFCLKDTTLATGSFAGYNFSDGEVEFLTETMQKSGKKPKFLPFRENLKETFKLFSKVHNARCGTDFQQDGFAALCETYELRNRLVHLKSAMTFYVSDKEKSKAGEAIKWLDAEIRNLFDACSRRYEQNPGP
jgi:hypothetical protein